MGILKKTGKGIAVVLIILIVFIIVGLLVLSVVSAVKNKTYYKYTTVEGKTDTKYAAAGGCGVSYMEYDAEDEKTGRYEIWYPDDLEQSGQKYPAVFNAAVKQEQGYRFRALYTASATSSYHTEILGEDWEYDVSAISVPVFMAAGGGMWDAGNAVSKEQTTDEENGIVQGICPLWSMEENYHALPDDIEKVYAVKTGADHGETYKQFDGYMTAWFLYQLKDDQEAGKAFAAGGELENNSLYQDVKTNII